MKKIKFTYELTMILFIIVTSVINSKSQEATKEEFKSSGKVWGYVFGDYYMKLHADSLNRGTTQYANLPKSSNAFEFRRIYFGYDYNISEKFSTEFLLAHEGTTLSDGITRTIYIKGANVHWKNILPSTELIIGQSSSPIWANSSEKVWEYRSVEKTIADMRKIGNSNDFGISLKSKLISNDNTELGIHLMIGNGSAQKLELDRFKKIYGNIYAKILKKKILIDLYADYERIQLSPFHKSKTTVKATLAYTSEIVTAGVEIYNQSQENYVVISDTLLGKNDTANALTFGASIFIRGQIIKDKLGYFARYDMYNPNTTFNADKNYITGGSPITESFITAGIDYVPAKNVHIMPNVWINSYNNRTKNAIGAIKSDYDLVARLTFWYIFK